jgi:hypothetical protein
MVSQFMTTQIVVACASPECLGSVNDVVHDCTFKMREIDYDRANGIVRVPFQGATSVLGSWFSVLRRRRVEQFLLEVQSVVSAEWQDSRGIETYNFRELTFDQASGVLQICTGIPAHFAILVGEIDIRVLAKSNV